VRLFKINGSEKTRIICDGFKIAILLKLIIKIQNENFHSILRLIIKYTKKLKNKIMKWDLFDFILFHFINFFFFFF